MKLLFQCFCIFDGIGVVIVIKIGVDGFFAFDMALYPFSTVLQGGFAIFSRVFTRWAVKANVNDIARYYKRCRDTY